MATLTGSGITFGDGNKLHSNIFVHRGYFSTNVNFNASSWTNGWQTPDWSMPAKSKCFIYYQVPCREDAGWQVWGGHYCRLYYRINSGNWVELGHSGFSSIMSYNTGSISRYSNQHVMDFSSLTNNFTLGFLFQHLAYSGSNHYIMGSNAIQAGSNSNYTGSTLNFYQHMIIEGFVDS